MVLRHLLTFGILLLALGAVSAWATSFTFNPTTATFTPASGVSFGGTSIQTLDFTLTVNSPLPGFTRSIGDTATLIYLGSLQILDTHGLGEPERDNLGLTIGFTLDSTDPSASGIVFSIPATAFVTTQGHGFVDVGFPTAFTYQSVAPGLLLGSRIVLGPNANGTGATSTARYLDDAGPSYTTLYYFAEFGTAVPEPATFALIGAGLVGVGLLRRRHHRQ